ncbi:site-specific integrase [Achromobacter sp. 2789STDY5608628]|uniref:site-specific integrase n=1 Tax=Achromobacter sp. 2789STDY5608628 TaxID=1806493 RepID=UPI0006C01134|nr:site-specific integrase [Achromobacter sp. 2789STDY5608628]CUJ68013.1 site-specific tyrosine recombinase XerC [Achromobacter sp. 2789STDY5608628]
MGSKQQFQGIYPREASIRIGFQWNGKRYRERVDLRPTAPNMRAAARMRDEILSAIDINKFEWEDFARYFPDSPSLPTGGGASALPTFREVGNTWLKLMVPEVAATTHQEYTNTMDRYWFPLFADRPIAELEYEELALFVASLPDMAAKTFNNIMTPLRGVFAYALKTKKVAFCITHDIDSRKGQQPPPDPLDIEEVELVLDHIQRKYHPQWHNYFEAAFFSGLRPSEEIALQWPKVDFRRQQARIDRARVRRIDKPTKTYEVRDIDLQTRALAALTRQKEHSFLAGGHVFLNPETGLPFPDTADAVRAVWRPTLKALGIRDRDARQTRHTFATLCLMAGMNPAYVSRQMGHKNAKMFFEIYSKWIDGAANDREKAKMDALFGSPAPKQLRTA